MAFRDRTGEFSAVLRSLQGRQLNGGRLPPPPAPARPHALRSYSEFMQIAKLIGKDIASTYAKLEKLTHLAKRKSIFDDRPVEIQELTHIIKQDMGSLNKQILQLQQLSRQRGPEAGKNVQNFSSNVVVTLQQKLANMSSQFKQVLDVRTENLRQQKSRRDQFSQGAVSSNLPPSATQGFHQGSVLLADEAASSARADVTLDMDGVRERRPGGGGGGGGPQQQQQQQQQMMLIEQEDTQYQERSETMKNIESTVVELGAIFQQLAHMVKEQEEMVQRIDANVDDTSMNVEAAHTEILKYFQSVTNNRWLMIKVFGVLIFFFLIFVVFMS